jgi:hypothetical protein
LVRDYIVGCTEYEVKIRTNSWIPIFAACAAGAVLVACVSGAEFLYNFGYQRGYQAAITKISKAVNASQYPTIRVALPSREAVAVIIGGICTPIVPTFRIPELAHIEYIGAYGHRCGPGKQGAPYADSAALAAIKNQVDATH